VFGSGLVLGFSMFAGEPRTDIQNAFQATVEILGDISKHSQQAQQDHEILMSFSDAIARYRERVLAEVRHTVQHYMERILSVEARRDSSQQSPHLGSRQPSSNQDMAATSLTDAGWMGNYQGYQAGAADASNFAPDFFDVQLDSPNLAAELQEFERLFYSLE
jgi:hypothetical protein